MLFLAGLIILRKSISCDIVLASKLSFDFIFANKVFRKTWYAGHRNKKCASSSVSNLQAWQIRSFGDV